MNQSAQEVVVTLVHGTWGRLRLPFTGRLWFESDSGFTKSLKGALEGKGVSATITPFKWSGANSLLDRRDAAYALSRYLYDQKLKNPDILQVVIGHSHGGTVCMLAAQRLSDGLNPLFVTLATPFMEIINSESTPTSQKIKKTLTEQGAAPAIFLAAMVGAALFADPGSPLASSAQNMFYNFGLVCLGIVPFFLGTREGKDGPDDLGWLRPERLGPKQFEQVTKGGATVDPPRDILVVRGVDDEANFALTAGALGNRISSVGVNLSVNFLRFLAWGMVPIALLVLSLFYFLGPTAADKYVGSYLAHPMLAYPVLAACGMVFLLPFVACLCKSVYGRELAIGGYFCDIKSGSSPDSARGVTMVTLPPQQTGMRHGLYNHDRVPFTIADFITR